MRLIALLLTALLAFAESNPVAAKSVASKSEHRGIRLVAVELPAQGSQDVKIMAVEPAMANIKRALDTIYARSPFSAKHIETLKRNGHVTLVYDARFPKAKMGSNVIAAFFPDFFQSESGGRKEFLVVVGRYGAKWPTDKLAAVIVHELVGHGLQHLRGRTGKDRKLDKECEALIYEERAYQDFGTRRDTRDMQQFRRDTRDKYCADFRHHLTKKGLNADKVWNFGRPDVPKLITHFDTYIAHLRRSGVAGKAVAAANAKRGEAFAALEKRALESGSRHDMYKIGNHYLKGLGVKRNAKKGAEWVRKSAKKGLANGQYLIGVLYNAGHGVEKDPIEAFAWLSLAAERGHPKARKAKRKLAAQLNANQLKAGEQRIQERRQTVGG